MNYNSGYPEIVSGGASARVHMEWTKDTRMQKIFMSTDSMRAENKTAMVSVPVQQRDTEWNEKTEKIYNAHIFA